MDLRREPALLLIAVLAPVVQLAVLFLGDLTVDQQGAVNAAAVALAGLLTAFWVKSEGMAAALAGFGSAAVAVALSFGWDLSPEVQTAIMAILSVVVAAWTRTQVVAPVPARVERHA